MKVLRWDNAVWWKSAVIWCRLAFWEETVFLAWFPYWLLTACWYLLFSLFIPTGLTLTTPQASEDPLKSKSPILMSRGSTVHFVVFAYENTGPAWRNYPQHSLVSDGGRRALFPFPPISQFSLLSFLSFWSHYQIFPSFYDWRLAESSLGNGWAEEDVWENAPEQAITFDKTTVPVGEKEES